MAPSSKRSQRTRRDTRRELSPSHIEDSSPSRPAKRRKKAPEAAVPSEQADDEDSSLLADRSTALDGDQLLSQVIQHLVYPKEGPVQASKDHANSIHEANQDGVKAYAKIAALDWTFYVTKLTVNIGRSSDPVTGAKEQAAAAEDEEEFVHIDLGPGKMVSRQHARILFNSEDEAWFLHVRGRNGVKVNNEPLKQGVAHPLRSGEVLEVGGTEMMFVLPTEISTLDIHPTYLKRAGLTQRDVLEQPAASTSLPGDATSQPTAGPSRAQPARQAIAPAPPDYKRPGTPPSTRGKMPASQHKSPGFSSSGTLLLNANDVDLSIDDNRHIKPQFSYAQMITQAIMNTAEGKLNLNGIYNFITTNYAYYRHQPAAGWQNSIRHNLSLNKSFDKIARSTDEPGKGMKWQIVPESRDEMIRSAYRGGRGGHRGSSAPSSPSHLNYITHGPGDVASREPMSRRKKLPTIVSPSTNSSLHAQSTPDRATRRHMPSAMVSTADGSPLPRARKQAGAGAPPVPTSSATYTSLHDQESPTLTSSIQDEGGSFITPAPLRVHPRLAPPSTAQRPSQHMPTSSPAPFWKYADIGSTPLKPISNFDISPSKPTTGGVGARPNRNSSSPPPAKSPAPSPTRIRESTRERTIEAQVPMPTSEPPEDDDEGGFDLTKGFQSIGSYHAPVGRGIAVARALNGGRK
ncbi:fork head domain-containing protein [Plectosphaerella cucumerina]|uniref:Fork head domain-containing protein n=1 Tax=Plectosphaerella cucumerina TaxID=40658 RepID=A0A8K0X0J1_9PEZI|nr:fork head domain-containing protein [Plectosphaerella cucumerina]